MKTDQLNGCIILDRKMYERAKLLAPHYGVMSLDTPLKVSDAVKLASPLLATIDNFFSHVSKEPAKPNAITDKLLKMAA